MGGFDIIFVKSNFEKVFKMILSVIVPVYNEENTIKEVVKQILAEKTPKEIIIIDDGSTDRTNRQLQSFKAAKFQGRIKIFRHAQNLGKGAAVRTGIKNATGDALVIQDADLEYDPNHYKRALELIRSKKAKVIYGSRLKNLKFKLFGKNKTPLPMHYLMNRFLVLMTNVLYRSKLTDMETGFKMLTREVYENLKLISDRFDIEPEITAKILKSGYQIVEFPITTKPRGYKQGKKIKAKDALFAIQALFKFWSG